MASSSAGAGGDGRGAPPSTPGTTRGRDQFSSMSGDSPPQARPRLGGSPGAGASLPPGAVPQEPEARRAWYSERGLNAPAVESEDETPSSNAADAYTEPVFNTAMEALKSIRDLEKRHLCGDATEGEGKERRAKAIEGFKNVGGRVEVLYECAAARLGLAGDLVTGKPAAPELDKTVVVAAPHARDRPEPGHVKKRPVNDKIKFKDGTRVEDGSAAYDAPVTPPENEELVQRILAFIKNRENLFRQEQQLPQLPLDFEKKLVADNGGKLTPRMMSLALKGSLFRLLDVAEGKDITEKDEENVNDIRARAKDEIRVLIRSCTEEKKGLPLPICVLATPGSQVYSDGSSVIVFESPSLTSGHIHANVDNLAIKKDRKIANSALCSAVAFRRGNETASRNAGTLQGGQGSSGGRGSARGSATSSATNAERRWPVKNLGDSVAHQAIVASFHEEFVHGESGPSALVMNELKPRPNTRTQYEICMGKLRLLPPRSALNAAIRIFGENGVIARARDPPTGADERRLWDQLLGGDEKKDILAAFLVLHAIRFADYDNILADQSRRVLPIFTDHSMQNFYVHVFRGLATLMKDANLTRPAGSPPLFCVETLERTTGTVRVRNPETGRLEEWEVPRADCSVIMLRRVLTMLSPYDQSQRSALTRVVGKEVTHSITVRQSLERTLASPRITGDYFADLTGYRAASVPACESLVHSAEHLLRLPVGGTRILGEDESLRDRSNDGKTTLSKIINTEAVNVDGESSVNFVFLRVSQEETAESQTRLGCAVQLDMWKSQLRDDRLASLNFPETDHVVWIASARSRLAANPLDQPVAIFKEDPRSDFRLPDLSTMKTATVRDAMKVALRAVGKNLEGCLVTMSAMYADRVTLEEFMHGAPAGVRVVGFDALDMRPLLNFFPEIALGDAGWKKRMIHVEKGYAGYAFVVHRLGAALATPCDLDVLRRAGMEAANQARTEPDREKTEKNLEAVAERTAKPLDVFKKDVVPSWFGAAKKRLVEPTIGMYGRRNNAQKVTHESTALLRHSGVDQLWRSQHQMLSWVVDLGRRPKVYLRPFPATQDLRPPNDKGAVPGFYVTNRWDDDGPRPFAGDDGARLLEVKDIKSANFFASTSRAANPGVFEHARDESQYLCLADVAIAAWKGVLDDAWVRPDVWLVRPSHPNFPRRLNLKNDYVYAVLRALRDGGHLPHRLLLGHISALGTAGAAVDSR